MAKQVEITETSEVEFERQEMMAVMHNCILTKWSLRAISAMSCLTLRTCNYNLAPAPYLNSLRILTSR
jgi:hypothetical protein